MFVTVTCSLVVDAHLLSDNSEGLPVGDVGAIVYAIADALDFAHQRGLLHRDVKPANILMTEGADQRRMLLADFGIGREISSTSGLTATNMTVGTVSYAAPEQLMANRFMGAQTNMRWGPPPTTC